VRALLATGMSVAEIAKKVGCTPGLVYVVKSTMNKKGTRGPGRPRKGRASAGLDGLAGILDSVKNAERERTQLRAALEKVQALLADALA
jgi:transposase-like protein